MIPQDITDVDVEITVGNLHIDREQYAAFVDGKPVRLTNKELVLLVRLASEPRRVYRKAELLKLIAPPIDSSRPMPRIRTVDSHVCRVRKALHGAGVSPVMVHNVWGVGYSLLAPGQSA